MTLLNIVSIVVTVVAWAIVLVLWFRYRRSVRDAEGAITVLDGTTDLAELPRDGDADAPAPDIAFASDSDDQYR